MTIKALKNFFPRGVSKTFNDKTLNYSLDMHGVQELGIGQGETTNVELNIDLASKDWYAFNEKLWN